MIIVIHQFGGNLLRKTKIWSRVDTQVSVMIVLVTVIFSIISIIICNNIIYNKNSLYMEQKILSIYDIISSSLDMNTFVDINTFEDMQKESYLDAKNMFEYLINIISVHDLYTIKENLNGDFVYVIDGSNKDNVSFSGEILDNEKQIAIRSVATNTKFLHKLDDNIFMTFLPIYTEESEIGILGIEFDISHILKTYEQVQIFIVFVCLVLSVIFVFLSKKTFHRISNPKFKDIYNIDLLTNLRNRNAFEVYTNNLQAKNKLSDIGIIVADIDKLKFVNDTFGHVIGDEYIKSIADVLDKNVPENMIVYRIGGDEFAIICNKATEYQLQNFISICQKDISVKAISQNIRISASFGYSISHKDDLTVNQIYKRADQSMYFEKFKHKRMKY